jgi:hypothetical protein
LSSHLRGRGWVSLDAIVSVIDLSQLPKPLAARTPRRRHWLAGDPRGGRLAECGGGLVRIKVMFAENVQRTTGVARAREKTNDNGFNIGVTAGHNGSSLYKMTNSSVLFTRRVRFRELKSKDHTLDWKGAASHDFQLKKD